MSMIDFLRKTESEFGYCILKKDIF